jgi:D-alanyl-D-alanine carboxypeptidase
MQATDRFRVASVTKTFVATLVLRLAAQGRLKLGDSVERWLPGLVPAGGTITLRELLNHTSGLYNYTDDPTWKQEEITNPGRRWSPRELVAFATAHPALFPTGTSWSYSNTNYILLGLVLEAVTGEPLGQELQEQLFQPLALRSTSFPTGTAIDGPYAHGYLGSGSGLVPPGTPLVDVSTLVDPSELWAAGGIVSTGDNLTRFYAQLLKGRVLPRPQLKAMETAGGASHSYGLGLRLTFTVCGEALGHDGDAPGYRNVVWATGNGRRVASIMVNIDTTHVSWDRLYAAAKNALCHG